MNKCKECNGTGFYTGFRNVERCGACNPSSKDEPVVVGPQIGDHVYVFDCEWYETMITGIGADNRVLTTHTYGRMLVPRLHITWNLTQSRWEYIRAGTPIY